MKIKRTESKREQMIKRVADAKQNYNKGKVKKGTVEDLLKDLKT
jgi:hypothetical protein